MRVFVLLALALPALAQQDPRGRIEGQVTDSTGAVVPQASLKATNADTRVATPTVSNHQGAYDILALMFNSVLGAMARAMADCPWANRIWRDQALVEFPTVDLALQVAVDDGLLAPVIRRADTLGLPGMAKERSRLVGAARSGRLSADAMGGAAAGVLIKGGARLAELDSNMADVQVEARNGRASRRRG